MSDSGIVMLSGTRNVRRVGRKPTLWTMAAAPEGASTNGHKVLGRTVLTSDQVEKILDQTERLTSIHEALLEASGIVVRKN